jgi:cytoskeletal protein CcmA (bactofilin family)
MRYPPRLALATRLGARLIVAVLVLAALGLAATPARAMEFLNGDTVAVPAGTTIADDLIATGESIVIAGRVTGDVYAFGRSVSVTGQIDRDLITAAQQVTVDGVITGDLRTAGQQVIVNGRIDGNTTAVGQLVTLSRQGALGGSVLAAAQSIALQGPVARGVTAAAATLDLGNSIGGDVQAAVSSLAVSPETRIAGRLEYTSDRQAAIRPGVAAGGVQYTLSQGAERARSGRERSEPEGAPAGNPFGVLSLAWLLGSIVVGVLLVHFFPRFAAETAAQVGEHPLSSFGYGTLLLFLMPAVVLFAAVTIVGLPLSLLAGLAYIVALYLGWLLFGMAAGGLLVQLAQRGGARWSLRPEWLVVLGLVTLYLVTHLPWIGGLIAFVALCLGFGALLRELMAMRSGPPAAVPASG